MRVGFIGLGQIGLPIALRLVGAGHDVHAFDLAGSAVAAAVSGGAVGCTSIAEVGDACEVVLLSLPSGAAVEAVTTGRDGLGGRRAVKCIVDLSTVGAATAHSATAALGAVGIQFVDAPVSGGVAGAKAGTLAIMVACPRPAYDALSPLLNVLGKLFHVGEQPGLGQTMKLVNNYLSATALAATSEAIVVGMKNGLDPSTMIEVLNAGSGRNSATLDKFPRAILPCTFDLGFTTGMMCKDLVLFRREAAEGGVELAIVDAVSALWSDTRTKVGADSDFSRIIQPLAEKAGVSLNRTGGAN